MTPIKRPGSNQVPTRVVDLCPYYGDVRQGTLGLPYGTMATVATDLRDKSSNEQHVQVRQLSRPAWSFSL